MKTINWGGELKRPSQELSEEIKLSTQKIIDNVVNDGDAALYAYTKEFDKADVDSLQVQTDQAELPRDLKLAIDTAYKNIRSYHVVQVPESTRVETTPGVRCELQYRPIETAGLYIPGGTAPLISTVLMLAVPAQIAGNKNIVMCTPPNSQGDVNPALLYAAKKCGVDSIFRVGGAQAIAAMAYGTESMTKVDKIFGPGNAWVTAAKQLVSLSANGVAIDMPAGPSEVMVIADDNAIPEFVAADLLSQAEHDVNSQVVLIAQSEKFISAVKAQIDIQLQQLTRKSIAQQALDNSCAIVASGADAIAIANQYAPEHLLLQTQNAAPMIAEISTAGSVFVGAWTPESLGDYASGCNHVLPTSGYARSYSGLGVQDYLRKMSVQTANREGLEMISQCITTLANCEGLGAHANAVSIRLQGEVS